VIRRLPLITRLVHLRCGLFTNELEISHLNQENGYARKYWVISPCEGVIPKLFLKSLE
jgi:hypothetical protein